MENNKEASQKVYVYDRLEVYVYELEDYGRRRRKIVVLDGAQHKVEDPPPFWSNYHSWLREFFSS